jgi:hypothetical protein
MNITTGQEAFDSLDKKATSKDINEMMRKSSEDGYAILDSGDSVFIMLDAHNDGKGNMTLLLENDSEGLESFKKDLKEKMLK